MNLEEYMSRMESRYKNPYIQIPRRLISDISATLNKYESVSYSHYAFSFLVVNAFLYKYVHYVDLENSEYINVSDIKEMLKYNPSNQRVNKISKRGSGILEEEGFVESTTDIPVAVYWERSNAGPLDKRRILRLSESGDDLKHVLYNDVLTSPNYCAYIPEFMIDYGESEGTLNNYSYTIKLTYKEFRHFIFNDQFNLRDFFLYCYIKSKTGSNGLAEFSYETAKRHTGLSSGTVKKISDKLETMNIITTLKNQNESRLVKKPNTYKIKNSFASSMKYRVKKKSPVIATVLD